jgi:hypothetical protein
VRGVTRLFRSVCALLRQSGTSVLGFRKWWTLYTRKMHPGFRAGSKETRQAIVLGCYIIPFIAILYADDFSAPEVAQDEAHKERERERERGN